MRGRDGRPLLTRQQARKKLDVSYSRLRRLHAKGVLEHVHVSPDGAYLFDAADVDRLELELREGARARSVEGELAARAFEAFAQGRTIREVVIELRETPKAVRALHRAFAEPDDRIVGGEHVRELEALARRAGYPLERASSWAAGLVELVRELVERDEGARFG